MKAGEAVYLQANVLRPPPVERPLTDPGLADHLRDGDTNFGQLTHLFHTESLFFISKILRPRPARFSRVHRAPP
jgi:hypothetical protein